MRRIDLACRLTETVAELVSSRFAFKATGPWAKLSDDETDLTEVDEVVEAGH